MSLTVVQLYLHSGLLKNMILQNPTPRQVWVPVLPLANNPSKYWVMTFLRGLGLRV